MSRLPDPGRCRWRRARAVLLTATAGAVAAQLVPWVHVVLVVLVATSWTVIGLLVTRALAHRYGLQRPAWASIPAATRAAIRQTGRLAGRLRASRHPAPATPPVAAERDWYELVGGPVGER